MSRIEELEKKIKELDKQKIELQQKLEIEKQKMEIEYPFEENEQYCVINADGSIHSVLWTNHKFDTNCFKQGNVFLIEKEAQKEAERRELLTRFRKFRDKCNGDWKPDFEDNNSWNNYISLNHRTNVLKIHFSCNLEEFNLFGYFRKESDAARAIKIFGDEIKRLYGGKKNE